MPAPPDPRVFRHEATISFQSLGYVEGASDHEFESPAAQLADTGGTNLPDNGISVTSSRAGTLLRIVGHADPTQLQPVEAEPR